MIGDGDTPHVRISRYDTSTSTSNVGLAIFAYKKWDLRALAIAKNRFESGRTQELV